MSTVKIKADLPSLCFTPLLLPTVFVLHVKVFNLCLGNDLKMLENLNQNDSFHKVSCEVVKYEALTQTL